MKKACLILEGGGNRGIYTSGVLDSFLENNIHFSNIYSVSAGALNAMFYLSKQKGRSFRLNKEYNSNDKYIDFKRVLNGNVVNLDYLFNEVNYTIDPFDFETFNKNKDNYIVTCTNIEKGTPVYKKIEDYDKDWEYIKASASLPLFSKVVKIDDYKLLDGGISDSIPLMKAIEDGYDKIVVVLTRDRDFIAKPYSLLNAYKTKYIRYANLIKTMENRHDKYNVTRDLIFQLEKEGKIFVISPSEPLAIKNLEKDYDKLEIIYNIGYNDANSLVSKLKDYLRGNKNE